MGRLAQLFAFLAVVGGIAAGVLAAMEPNKYILSAASVVQLSAIYAQAGYYAQLSIICFLFAIAALLSALTERLGSK